jgi:hypothetical protein
MDWFERITGISGDELDAGAMPLRDDLGST